ncbi:phage tail protein [Photorhabdus thracensis]|nr:phage tail protein [Photorhabdus thracensis]MCC8421489.1 tail fiber protein [Photorhabdus thracensis]
MAKNEFLTFGMAEGANVLSNDEYAALAARVNGFSAGVAKSRELNKAWRQSSIITHILADFIAKESGNDVLDNGNIDALKSNLALAIKNALPEVRDATLTEKGIIQLSNATDSTSERLAATPRAVKYAYDLANTANNNANTKLAKSQNGADIPDKNAFVKNLGLSETVNRANGAVSSISGGTIKAGLNVQSVLSVGISQNKNLRISSNETADSQINLIVWGNSNRKTIFECGDKNGCLFYSHRLSSNNVELFSTGKIIPSDYSNFDARYDNVPAGVPMPYPHRYTPPGYLTCNGQTFDKSLYPKLAEAYPAGRVPDLRGEFIRGWDDSRGVDPGRVCGTWQGDAFQGHKFKAWSDATRASATNRSSQSGGPQFTGIIDQSLVVGPVVSDGVNGEPRTANETRPRNVAFNYIVRAA